jgi:hypothetical protein
MVSVLVSLAITVLTRSNLSCGAFARLTAVYRVVQLVVNVHRRISVAQAQCISEVEIRSLITVSQFFSSEKNPQQYHQASASVLSSFTRASLMRASQGSTNVNLLISSQIPCEACQIRSTDTGTPRIRGPRLDCLQQGTPKPKMDLQ